MKTKFLAALMLCLSFNYAFAQIRGINYKALIADNSGNPLTNQSVTLQFTVLEGSSATTEVYKESHTTTTDASGIVVVNIGEGVNLMGDFTTINWGLDKHFIKTEVDTGSGFVDLGTTEFKTVPYALYAESSGGSGNVSPFAEASPNVISANNTNADFLVGSTSTEDANDINLDSRLFFDKTKVAFRAGAVDGAQWNDSNRGLYSFGAGRNTQASGVGSTVFGRNTSATSSYATALGDGTTAAGSASLAVGVGTQTNAYGQMATGRYNVEDSNAMLIVGNGTDDASRATIFKVMNDGNVIVPNLSVSAITDDNALITKAYFEGNSSSGLDRIDEGGGYGWRLKTRGPDNYGEIGLGAVDFSFNDGIEAAYADSGALGRFSSAFGVYTTSLGLTSFALGFGSNAKKEGSLATGLKTSSEGDYASTFGMYTIAKTDGSMAIGKYNVGLNDALFEVGNGVDDGTRNNALTIATDGTVTISNLSGTGANVKVHANGQLYAETNTDSYYSLSASDFHPNSNTTGYLLSFNDIRITDNNQGSLFAPVHLPHDAMIKDITYYYLDNGSGNLRFKLHFYNMITNEIVDIANGVSTNGSNSVTVSNINEFVFNDQYSCFIEVFPQGENWSVNYEVRGVKITYVKP